MKGANVRRVRGSARLEAFNEVDRLTYVDDARYSGAGSIAFIGFIFKGYLQVRLLSPFFFSQAKSLSWEPRKLSKSDVLKIEAHSSDFILSVLGFTRREVCGN